MRGLAFILAIISTGLASPYWIYFTDKGSVRSVDFVDVAPSTARRRLASPLEAASSFEDIPLHPRYLRIIELSGARIRARSRWLNAVSVETEEVSLIGLNSMRFISRTAPVAVIEIERAPQIRIMRTDPIDSVFFGDTYLQLELLNIPAVHNLGLFGSGVKVGFLDSGLRRDHPVFSTLKLGSEHDFITGDELMLYSDSSHDYVSILSNYEILQQPELHGDVVLFIADYLETTPPSGRPLYAASRSGQSWSAASPITPIGSSVKNVVRSYAVTGDDTMMLVWEQGTSDSLGNFVRNLYSALFEDGDLTGSQVVDADSRNPQIITYNDTSYLFYVKNDGTVRMDRGVLDAGSVSWLGDAQVLSVEDAIMDRPAAAIFSDTILLAALDLVSGELHMARSTDGGSSFSGLSSPAEFEVAAFDLDQNYLITAEIDPSSGAFSLHSYMTGNAGDSWTDYAHPETYPVIGHVDLMAVGGGGLHAVFENAGEVYLTSSTGAIESWSEAVLISTAFSYQPSLGTNTGDLEVVWAQRGDDDVDFDEAEDGRDANYSQPAHGSRVTGLVAGYQARKYIGAAPGVEVYAAKTEKHIDRLGTPYELRVEEDTWIEGLEWLERQGVDIVNSSLSYGAFYSDEQADGKTSPASRAATMAAQRGVLITNAAGNVNSRTPYIRPPGDAYDILTVGGTDTLGNWWAQGEELSGSAVGLPDDGRIKPELVAPAAGIYVIDVDNEAPDDFTYYFYGNGTSYAAPLVAGGAALMLEAHPEYRGNPDTLIALLTASASQASTPDDTLGWGIPDIYEALQPLPDSFEEFTRNELLAPFPNPFYPVSQTTVYFPFRLNQGSSRILIKVFTLSGELVAEKELVALADNDIGDIGVGVYDEIEDLVTMGAFWDGLTANGQPAAAGLYLVALHTQYGSHVNRFVLVR